MNDNDRGHFEIALDSVTPKDNPWNHVSYPNHAEKTCIDKCFERRLFLLLIALSSVIVVSAIPCPLWQILASEDISLPSLAWFVLQVLKTLRVCLDSSSVSDEVLDEYSTTPEFPHVKYWSFADLACVIEPSPRVNLLAWFREQPIDI